MYSKADAFLVCEPVPERSPERNISNDMYTIYSPVWVVNERSARQNTRNTRVNAGSPCIYGKGNCLYFVESYTILPQAETSKTNASYSNRTRLHHIAALQELP